MTNIKILVTLVGAVTLIEATELIFYEKIYFLFLNGKEKIYLTPLGGNNAAINKKKLYISVSSNRITYNPTFVDSTWV